ncbi:MAG: hemolysin family protein [Anaerolineae bacterium]
MPPAVIEAVFVLLLILANGVFAMSEIAVVTSRKTRLQQQVSEGDRKAADALELAEKPNHFLSTVQIGITLIGVLAGAFSGATLAGYLEPLVAEIPPLAPYAQAISITVVVVVITFLTLVIGELVPKRLALNDPERIAGAVAGPMNALTWLATPAVRLLSFSTDLVMRLLGVQLNETPPVTEEEIRILLEQGTQAGVFAAAESDMVESVFSLDDRRASSLMTPRHDVVWLDTEDPVEEIQRKIIESGHSRFPVARDSLDNVLGEAQARDLLARAIVGEPFDLQAVLRAPLYVPEVMSALNVLEHFKSSGTEMALVIDEYGFVTGLVTLDDILEAIVGEIPTAEELAEPPVVQREDGSWLMDGMVLIDEFRELFDLSELPGEDHGLYQTLGGFVTSQLGAIPTSADRFEWNDLRFEVVDMDGNRVDKVLVTPAVREDSQDTEETS